MNRLGATTLAAAIASFVFAAPALANADVQITQAGFQPAALTIGAGESVNWVNRDTVDHTLVSTAAKLQSPKLTPSDNFGFTFTTPGTFTVTDASAPSIAMTITVTAARLVSVHLAVAPKAVLAGGAATLRGTISTHESGKPVRIEAQTCGSSSFAGIRTVTTGTGGMFALSVRPKSSTTYRVRYVTGQATVRAEVRPRLLLRRTGSGRFSARLSGAKGRTIAVQVRSGGGWKSAGSARLHGSTATFRLPAGTTGRVRVSIDSKSTGACLATGVSNVVSA
jgi:plastocyanin